MIIVLDINDFHSLSERGFFGILFSRLLWHLYFLHEMAAGTLQVAHLSALGAL